MRRNTMIRSDRFGTNLSAKLSKANVGPKPDQRHKGEVALSLLALACEQMARGERPLQK